MARQSYTLFLAKQPNPDFRSYLTESAKLAVGSPLHQSVKVPDLGESAELHIFRGSSGPPSWMRRLSKRIPEIEMVDRRSVAGVLFIHTGAAVLVITFSHGWMLISENLFESDFGLRVAINALDPEKMKRLERANLGDALQAVSQSPFQRDFRSFGVDDALDLVKKLSGAAQDHIGLDTISGSRSLKITGEYSLDDVVDMIGEIISFFNSKEYQNTAFRIIDSVRPVTDGILRDDLFDMAIDSIKAGEDRFELSLPSNSEAEGVSFKFAGPGLRHSYPDLLLRHYTAALGTSLATISRQTLEDHKIIAQFDDDRPNLSWTLKKSLLGSISKDGERYAINDGQWYRVDNTFKDSVEARFVDILRDWDIPKPPPIRKIYDHNNRNGRLEREEDYNARIAKDLGLILLDQKEITIPEVSRSGFEPCDLLDLHNKRFIHVKKSSRRSNILSHFFKQGSNSAQQFRKVGATWTQLSQILSDMGHDNEAVEVANLAGEQVQGWTVEYWIADAPRINGNFNIPFFSKISLRDEVDDLRAMQYDVALRFIEIPPDQV